jgi:phosphopantothenoylcysteine decarboxylase/phosphopantothenate--cysteine ligase
MVIAPVTATTLARLAHGLADNLLSLTVLATKAPVLLAPAMDSQMYDNAATQENLSLLKQRGMTVVGPEQGRLATGRRGPGRLVDTDMLMGALRQMLGRSGDLAGRKVVVSAGGTQEPIDPVRYVSNYSSGKMGYAVAEAARDRGAQVVVVSAPVSVPAPYGVQVVSVKTAEEMRDALVRECSGADVLVMAAAVADYRPAAAAGQKIKRTKEGLSLELVRTPDILSEVKGPLRVGFAAESEKLVENAADKLKRKGLDLIVANDVTAAGSGFGTDTNEVTIIGGDGEPETLPLLSKYEVGHRIFDRVIPLLRRP